MDRTFGNFETGENPENSEKVENGVEQADEIDNYFDSRWKDDEQKTSLEKKEDVNEEAARKITCRNEELEGGKHPETSVPFERKNVTVDGEKVEGVFPQFESRYDTKLPEELYKESDSKQFEYCSQQLKETIKENPKLAEQFNSRQYQQIMDGAPRISGYTWHHTENPGEMQLVDADTHAKTGHTGGRSLWGGGAESR